MTAINGHSNVIASVPAAPPAQHAAVEVSDRTLGFLLVAVCPAVFWTVMLALVGWLRDWNVSLTALAGSGLAIAGFLGLIFGAVSMRDDGSRGRSGRPSLS